MPGKIRVGQEDAMNNASVLTLTGDGTFEVDASAVIAIGKNLLVDFVDPSISSPNNSWSAAGHIVVYGEKRIIRVSSQTNDISATNVTRQS